MLLIPLKLLLSCGAEARAEGIPCSVLPALSESMLSVHYDSANLGSVVYDRTAEGVIAALDPQRTLLLASEVELLEVQLPEIGKTGNCKALQVAGKHIIERSAADAERVARLLGDDYALDETASLIVDPSERPWPASEEERAARVDAMVHFSVSNQLLADRTLEEARKTVAHRYKLLAMRLAERRADDRLPEMYAESFAVGLDPHSSYFTPRALADFEIAMSLSLEGIGAVLGNEEGITIVQRLVAGGAADKQGQLRPKDRIVAVAQEGQESVSVIDMDLSDVVTLIRGKKGTAVTLTVEHDGNPKPVDIRIVRDTIDVEESAASIRYETRQRDGRELTIAVLDLPSFYGDEKRSSYDDVKQLLGEATAKGVDGLVLDVSDNGGGRLEDAVRISGLFINKGAVVATQDAKGTAEILEDREAGTAYSGPMVVLVSSASASASEILAGALQDYGRAAIVGGEKTFGKGSVQQMMPLAPGMGALKLTMSMFFRPSGASTQLVGVASDIRIPSVYDGFDINEGMLDYSLPATRRQAFLSSEAQSSRKKDEWPVVTAATLQTLGALSAKRVEASAVLTKLLAEQAEDKDMDDDKGPITVAQARAEAGDALSDDEAKALFESRKEAFVGEAVEIAADLSVR